MAAQWPADRLLAVWNSLPGVTPVKKFTDRKTAVGRISARIQGFGEPVAPKAEPATERKDARRAQAAKRGGQSAKGAPAQAKAAKKATPGKNAPQGKKAVPAAKPADKPAGARGGSKMAQVIEMMQRKGGATIEEIMKAMSWQRHTVRGFVARAMKKAGYAVESFKPEGGERTYRLNK